MLETKTNKRGEKMKEERIIDKIVVWKEDIYYDFRRLKQQNEG